MYIALQPLIYNEYLLMRLKILLIGPVQTRLKHDPAEPSAHFDITIDNVVEAVGWVTIREGEVLPAVAAN